MLDKHELDLAQMQCCNAVLPNSPVNCELRKANYGRFGSFLAHFGGIGEFKRRIDSELGNTGCNPG